MTSEARTQKDQNKLFKAMVAVMEAMEEIDKASETMPKLKSSSFKDDGLLHILSSVHREASFKRREKAKLSINENTILFVLKDPNNRKTFW